MILLTPLVILVFGLLVIWTATRFQRKVVLWCAGTYIFASLVEMIGVHTGSIFGRYVYGPTLGPKLLGVPLVIGLNWVLVVLAANAIARTAAPHPVAAAMTAGALTVIFDFPLEIAAMRLDYWQWIDPPVPIRNYIAWFIIAAIAAFAYNHLKIERPGRIAVHYLIVQFLFFIIIAFALAWPRGLTSTDLALY